MADTLGSRLRRSWNVFRDREGSRHDSFMPGDVEVNDGYRRSGRTSRSYRFGRSGERSIINSIYTRMAIDFAAADFRHVRVGKNNQFLETIQSSLNDCLTLNPNLDQEARTFFHDFIMTLFEEGHAVVVPVDTTGNPDFGAYDILSLRVGKVTRWFASSVMVDLYDQRTGQHREVMVSKEHVAIVENPFYSIMNETNSTLQRLLRKLQILDALDEELGAGKLDLIIQLPYVVKTDARREQAEKRRKDIEVQLRDAQYGIAYTDSTEKITQLNRPTDNNMLKQIEYLTQKLYVELGMTAEVVAGTADEQIMLNYSNRTIDPLWVTTANEFTRKFLTKTARTQNQRIKALRDPFKSTPIGNIAELVDKFTRNEIASSNEMRGVIGWYPSEDPKADELRNANISAPKEESVGDSTNPESLEERRANKMQKRATFESLLFGVDPNPNEEKDTIQNET